MSVLVKNATTSVAISLTVLKMVGFWAPDHLEGTRKLIYSCYTVLSFMFLLGTYVIIQVVDLFLIWGNIPLMTGTAFLLFTNLAHSTKIVNILARRRRIQAIVDDANRVLSGVEDKEQRKIIKSCNKEMTILLMTYFSLTLVTLIGWATSAENGELPLRAWYPYDTSKSPAHELTYVHQVVALFIAACLNVAKDTLVAALIAQCRCRLRLIGHALRNLGQGLEATDKYVLTPEQEASMSARLRWCVQQHQEVLQATAELQACFSAPTFAQFTVSLVIICVTAFQLSMMATGNMVRLLSMGTYLMNMSFQVFIYCYQGNQLSEESSEVAVAAYWCPWYMCSVCLRRALLIVMVRTRRVAKLTAGGFTTLSLASFMAIIKASYSLFTLLQQASFIIIAQTGAIFQIWGDITLMTNASFLLFTNLAFAMKMINIVVRRRAIRTIIDEANDELIAEDRDEGIEIIKSCNRETTRSLYLYIWLSVVTISGWAVSAEKGQLPLRAWYPYDTSKSPAYELTYINQCSALGMSAMVNICLDTLVTSLIAVCCCRLRLVGLSLRTLCDNAGIPQKLMLCAEDEKTIQTRLQRCVVRHESALKTAEQIQTCFSQPILAQFSVSIVIICVTAYQLALELQNRYWVRIMSMVTYLLCMMLQVFLYCYQGNQLTEESSEIAGAAFSCPWYMCSVRLRRALLIVMVRTRRVAKLTAGGFTTLSLACFMSIIKASYTFFTVLKQVDERKEK